MTNTDNRIGKLFIVNKNMVHENQYNNWFIINNKKGNWITLSTHRFLQYENNLSGRIFIFLGIENNLDLGQVKHKFLIDNIIVQTYIGDDFLKECSKLT